jgi:ribonucleoside-triphosphate reductase
LVSLIGCHHGESPDAQALGLEIIAHMRDRTDEFADYYDLNYTLLATPAEGLSGRFLKMDREAFGVMAGVTDKDYYTNSFHVPVDYPISMFDKMTVEGPYHKYCNAGHISYVELPSPPEHNTEALEALLRHMIDSDMGYAGVNFPIDFCLACGQQGVFPEDCPTCGSQSIRRIRRITGYFSTIDRFNDAKKKELADRITHQ